MVQSTLDLVKFLGSRVNLTKSKNFPKSKSEKVANIEFAKTFWVNLVKCHICSKFFPPKRLNLELALAFDNLYLGFQLMKHQFWHTNVSN